MDSSFTASNPMTSAVNKFDDVILGGGRYRENELGPDKFVISRVIPANGPPELASANFFPHGFAFTSHTKKLAYAFEKIGPGAGLYDLEKMQLLETIPAVKNRLFYGHGVCSADGELLYSTETTEAGDGAIGVRETNSLNYLGDFPTFGSHPHDCHLLENGTVLAVSNAGGTKESGQRASICYIDIQSERLLERIEMPDERFNAGHFYPLHGRQSIVVSAPRRGLDDKHLGAISVQSKKPTLDVVTQPLDVVENMLGEALSVLAIPEADMFVVTHPIPGMLTFWKLSTGELFRRFNFAKVRGLALTNDHNGIWVSYGPQAELIRINLANLEIVSRTSNTYLTGSHLYNA